MAVLQLGDLAERRRSMSVRLYGLDRAWDDAPSEDLDQIAVLVRDALGTDGAAVNLITDDLQVTVGGSFEHGAPLLREHSVCSTVLRLHHDASVVEIPDLRDVPELADNPYVDGTLGVTRFYAAAPLIGRHGLALGTLCTWSTATRHLDEQQRALLRQLGRAAVNVLDERRRALVPDAAGALRPAR